MGFLLCGRCRIFRRSSTTPAVVPPSTPPTVHLETAPVHQHVPVEDPPARREDLEGISSLSSFNSISTAASYQIAGHERHSSSGWSDRVRRRLPSRDSKSLHPISKRVSRQSGISLFTLPKRPSFHKNHCVSGGVAGSLLSIRGYDSDAQCISTPKQTMAPSDRPQAAISINRNLSPLRNTLQATEDFTHEKVRNLADEQQNGNEEASASPQPTAHVEWSPQSLRGVPAPECATSRVASPVSNASSHSINDRNTGSSGPASMSEILGDAIITGTATPTKSRPGMKEVKPRFYATVAQQGFRDVDPAPNVRTSYAGSSESLARNGMRLTIAKKRWPTSRETSSEAGSLHLDNMNISKALASPSMSPRILSQQPCTDGSGQRYKYHVRSFSDQYHECAGKERVSTPPWCKPNFDFDLSGRRDGSSFYSPKSSISVAGMSTDLRLPDRIGRAVSSPVGSGRQLSSTENVSASPTSETSQMNASYNQLGFQPNAVRSKFVEEFETNRSISSGSIEAASRKVSIGWMSGGRRLGYGYTLVSEDGGQNEDQEAQTDSDPNTGIEASSEANHEPVETTATCSNRQSLEEQPDSNKQRISSSSDRSGAMSRLSQRWSGSSGFARATKSIDSTDRSSTQSFFWDRFTRRNDLEDSTRHGAKGFRRGLFASDLNQPEDEWKRSSWYESGRKTFLDKWIGMRFPLDSELDQHNAADEHDMETRAQPDTSPFDSLRQPKKKFRVLNRRRRRSSNRSTSDRHSIRI